MLWVLCGSVYLRCPQYYNDTPFVSVCNYLANFIIGLKSDRLEKEVITINVNFLKFPLSVSDMAVFELEPVLIRVNSICLHCNDIGADGKCWVRSTGIC